jgi:hypothetical protein
LVTALAAFAGRLLVATVGLRVGLAAAALLAGFARFFAAGFLVDAADRAGGALPDAVLEDFLSVFFRVFLDIRLPFVAFDGSIIRLSQAMSWQARIE